MPIVKLCSESDANIFSSRSLLLSFKHSSNCGTTIEHAASRSSLSSSDFRPLLIQHNVTRLARAKRGMPLAIESDRAASNLPFPLETKAIAAFLCQISAFLSSSFWEYIYMHLPSYNIGNEIAKGRRCLRLLDVPRFYARRGLLSSAAISLSLVLQCKKNVLPESTELLLLLLESCRQKPDNLVLLRAHLSTLLCIRYTLDDDLPSRKQKQLMRTSM